MKWSEYDNRNFYKKYSENEKCIKGYWLTTLGIDLDDIPNVFNNDFILIKSKEESKEFIEKKVFLEDIVGTSHIDYSNIKIIESYIRLKRGCGYIEWNKVTKNKYFQMLRKPIVDQELPIILSKREDEKYYVDGNGNHRVIFFKMMMLAEIIEKYSDSEIDDYRYGFKEVREKYFLMAKVRL